MSKSLFLDFEFNRILQPKVNLVSCATFAPKTKEKRKFWLHNKPDTQKKLSTYLKEHDTIIAYAAIAECRSFISLGLEPLDWDWIDLFLEYRMLTNHNDRMAYGRQLVDGKVRFTKKPPPKWERVEGEKTDGFRPTHSLAEATFKLTGKIRNTAHKDATRDLIISDPDFFTPEQRKQILDYNMDDVVFLSTMWKRIKEKFMELILESNPNGYDINDYIREAKERGRYSAHTAWMETRGYPVNLEATRNFSRQVGNILYDVQREINGLFPEIKPFVWNRPKNKFSTKEAILRKWIEEHHDGRKWMKTKGRKLSLALEAWEKAYHFQHDYPTDNFGAQMVRFLKLKQSLYGFSSDNESSSKKTFWDNVGPDGRVRPYMNIYGAQSGRSQPAATGFMFLKPAWMRALVQPARGHFMFGIDYASQEFFLSALESGDIGMIDAYLSGDVYLAFGKDSGQIPRSGTKESHKFIRDLCKSTVLGISYLMTKYGLAIKLSNDTGKVWTEDDAEEQIEMFGDAYPDFIDWQQDLIADYADGLPIRLPCGWTMWGDNDNHRSVANVPIQGRGATIMRKAVDLNHRRGGANCVFTLHDALYGEDMIGKEEKIITMRDAMRDAFVHYAPKKFKKQAALVRLDPFAWSPNYERDGEIKLFGADGKPWKVPTSDLYIDERAQRDYDKFSIYFDKRVEDTL